MTPAEPHSAPVDGTEPSTAMSPDQYAQSHPPGMERSYWHRARNAILWRKLAARWSERPTVLDIGCGPGIVVDFLRQRGVDCHGVDLGVPHLIHPRLAAFTHLGQDAFELPEQFRQQVRVLLFMDVLEHLPDPNAFLLQCERAFPSVDTWYATLPARQELWSNYDDHYGHYRRYALEDLPALLRGTSFQLSDSGYFFQGLYYAIRMSMWLQPERPVAFSTPRFDPIQRFLGGCFSAEQRVLPKGAWGSSLYALIEKKR